MRKISPLLMLLVVACKQQDYNADLISAGGGVFPRSQKAIPVSAEVAAALGIAEGTTDPSTLIQSILKAPVDLLWFGGIGTYIKAASETNAAAGDPANDANRVDAAQLRAKVIGEGANLSTTQAGRIELINGKDPHAALRAPWPADQPIAASSSSVGQCRIHDLNELRVPKREAAAFRLHSYDLISPEHSPKPMLTNPGRSQYPRKITWSPSSR